MIHTQTLNPFFGCRNPASLIATGSPQTYLNQQNMQQFTSSPHLQPPPRPPPAQASSTSTGSLQQNLYIPQLHSLPPTYSSSISTFNLNAPFFSDSMNASRPASTHSQPVFSTLISDVTIGVNGTTSPASQPSPVAALAAAMSSPLLIATTTGNPVLAIRDSQWLKLRVCQAFLKSVLLQQTIKEEKCPYTPETCPLAHPKPNVKIELDHVTVCYDFIKRNDCRHANCKYYHPPAHQIEAVLKRGDVNKKGPNQPPLRLNPHTPLMGQSQGLCWPSGLASTFMNPTGILPTAGTTVMSNPTVNMAMLAAAAAMRGYPSNTSPAYLTAGYPGSVAPPPAISPRHIDPNFASNYGFYAPVSSVAPVPTMLPTDFQSSLLATSQASSASAIYAVMAAANAAVPRFPVPVDHRTSNGNCVGIESVLGKKRKGDNETSSGLEAYSAFTQSKRPNVVTSTGGSKSTNGEDTTDPSLNLKASEFQVNFRGTSISASPVMSAAHFSPAVSAAYLPAVSQTSSEYASQQLAHVLAFNSILQQQQNSQLISQAPIAQTATSPIAQQQAQAQQHQQIYMALMRLQAAHQLQQQQQQQQQQLAAAAMMGGYSLSSLVPGFASTYPAGLIDPLTFQNQAASGLTSTILQNQPILTNVAYINDEGQLLESLPICRDFKAGKCHRNTDCRYVHLVDENVEVNQGRVTVCRDAAKGRCTRIPCKYYHIPLFAISASRSLALNSALASATSVSNNTSSTTAGSI